MSKIHGYFDAEFLRRLEGLHLLAKRLAERGPAGGRLSRALGDGLEFVDHRAYTPGDDVRFLDWLCYARMEKLLVRLFHRHSESDVAILLDTSASMAGDGGMKKFDAARRIAAALAYVAVGAGRRVLAQPFGEALGASMKSARDRAKLLPLLEFLDTLTPAGATNLAACAHDFAQRTRNVGAVILISDLLDAGEELSPALASLHSTRRELAVLQMIDPQDASPQPAGAVELKHAENGLRVRVDVTAEICERYTSAWREFCQSLQHTCRARQAIHVPIDVETPLETVILQILRQSGVVGR